MGYRFAVISIILFFTGIDQSEAQFDSSYVFRHIDQANGLLHNNVYSITQDGNGFIWILTANGLQRYDGSGFVNFPYNLKSKLGNSYNTDRGLFADKKNNQLWIINKTIEKFDLLKNSFSSYTPERLLTDSNFLFKQYKDSINSTWLAGDFGIFRMDRNNQTIGTYFVSAPYLTPGSSNSFSADTAGKKTWMAIWSFGLLLFDETSHRVYSHQYNPIHDPLLEHMTNNLLFYVFVDHEKNIWIASGNSEFYRYNPRSKKITTYSLSQLNLQTSENNNQYDTRLVHCFFEDNHQQLWIGTQNAGLLKYDKEKDKFISITTSGRDQQGIRYNYDINSIFQDAEDNLWLGSDKGVTIFNPYRRYFRSVRHEEYNTASLPLHEIQGCIQTSKADILVGTWGGGITVYDSLWHFKKTNLFPSAPEEHNKPWCFIQNDDGTIWAGCQHGYIHIYDPIKETFQTIHPPELNSYTIRCMAKDKKGNIYLGLHNGKIAMWNKATKKFHAYNENIKGLMQDFAPIRSIFIDDHQACWVGTENGLKQFDADKMLYSAVYLPDNNNQHALSGSIIQDIEKYDDSTLLIGTIYGGLNFFNAHQKTFSHISTDNETAANTVNNIKKDKNNLVWFTTDYGLFKYSPVANKITRYKIEPGTINSSFKEGHFYTLQNGQWVTCTDTEIIYFNPDSLQQENQQSERVHITGFRAFDKNIFIDSFLYKNIPVQLPYDQNFLSIEYGIINFSGLLETKYHYQLSGLDKDWVYAGTTRTASYTNLQPGDYTFKVKSDNGYETAQTTSFQIVIVPPFWRTWWFLGLCVSLIVLVIYLLVRRRINTIRFEAGLKHKIAETEMKALRAQMNPHFIFNCLNSIDNLIQNNEKEKATLYLSKFAKLIRSILETSRNNTVPCWKDMDTLKLYLEMEELRWDKKFSYEINIASEIINGDYKVPPLVIQPFVENAIHHGLLNKSGSNGILKINVSVNDNCIHYQIEDNGVGRARAASYKQLNNPIHESVGLQITTDRINLFNQNMNGSVKVTDLSDEQQLPCGTKVEVTLFNQP